VHSEDGAPDKHAPQVGARHPQRDAFQEQDAAQKWKADRQAQREDLDRPELRQQDLRGDEGPAPDDNGAEKEETREQPSSAPLYITRCS
jgi:hypothetical protein